MESEKPDLNITQPITHPIFTYSGLRAGMAGNVDKSIISLQRMKEAWDHQIIKNVYFTKQKAKPSKSASSGARRQSNFSQVVLEMHTHPFLCPSLLKVKTKEVEN